MVVQRGLRDGRPQLAPAALPPVGQQAHHAAEIEQEEARRIPLGRRGRPEEVAQWVLRLVDPASTWLTGQVLTVDGGLELV